MIRAKFEGRSDEAVAKVIELALAGDVAALKIWTDRISPALKPVDTTVTIQGLKGTGSLVQQGQAIIDALAAGEITPDVSAMLMRSIQAQSKNIEIEEIEQRLDALEKANA